MPEKDPRVAQQPMDALDAERSGRVEHMPAQPTDKHRKKFPQWNDDKLRQLIADGTIPAVIAD